MSIFVAIRRKISSFYKTIHPDAITHFPEIAKQVNSKSLSELNGYLDLFKYGFSAGFVSKKLNFFKPYLTITGKSLTNRIQPISITLPCVPPEATNFDLINASERLIENINVALKTSAGSFKPLEQSIELPETHSDAMQILSNLVENEMVNQAFLQVKFLDKKILNEAHFILNGIRKQNKYRNGKKANLVAKRGKLEIKRLISQLIERESEFLSSGVNLNYVFLKNTLTEIEKQVAMEKISGITLCDNDLWLLKNIWNILHHSKPKIPIVIQPCDSSYSFCSKYGYIKIPCNFDLMALIEFLELYLDEIRIIKNGLIV